MSESFNSTSNIQGYPKNLSTLNTIKKSDTFYELPVATAQSFLKNGKLSKEMKKKMKEIKEQSTGKVYITFENLVFDLDIVEYE
jgi:hypothetical protein